MGIYSSGAIFGIQIYNFNENGVSNILFEEKFDEKMSHHQMSEAYLFYSTLNNKDNVKFNFYTECSSTLSKNKDNFMMWHPLSLESFLNKFNVNVIQ